MASTSELVLTVVFLEISFGNLFRVEFFNFSTHGVRTEPIIQARRCDILAFPFPTLPLEGWQPTRDTVQVYTQVLGKIRESMAPQQKYRWHVSLRATATGLCTMPILSGPVTFEVLLDLALHKVLISTSRGERWSKPLNGQSEATFARQLLGALSSMGIHPDISRHLFDEDTWRSYDPRSVERFWRVLSRTEAIFQRFKAGLYGESSPVQFLPGNFHLALTWFSGRQVPDTKGDYVDEAMHFGFSTGDDQISGPYFYASVSPMLDKLSKMPLPSHTFWFNHDRQEAIMMYDALSDSDDPEQTVLGFLEGMRWAGARCMTPKVSSL
jgi:hypothetical protein